MFLVEGIGGVTALPEYGASENSISMARLYVRLSALVRGTPFVLENTAGTGGPNLSPDADLPGVVLRLGLVLMATAAPEPTVDPAQVAALRGVLEEGVSPPESVASVAGMVYRPGDRLPPAGQAALDDVEVADLDRRYREATGQA